MEWIIVSLGLMVILFSPIINGQSATELLIEAIQSQHEVSQKLSELP